MEQENRVEGGCNYVSCTVAALVQKAQGEHGWEEWHKKSMDGLRPLSSCPIRRIREEKGQSCYCSPPPPPPPMQRQKGAWEMQWGGSRARCKKPSPTEIRASHNNCTTL